jgi:hypothetical protein
VVRMTGEWRLQYRCNPGPWWTGNRGLDLNDPAKYVALANSVVADGARHIDRVRAISNVTGEILGDQGVCSMCNEPHDGRDGVCLI